MGDSQLSMTASQSDQSLASIDSYHSLRNSWVMWAHLPHDTDWSLKSYKKIGDINNVVEYENSLECNLNDDSCLSKIKSIHWCRTLDGEIWYDSKKKKNYCTFEKLDGEHKTIGELLKCDLDNPNGCNF